MFVPGTGLFGVCAGQARLFDDLHGKARRVVHGAEGLAVAGLLVADDQVHVDTRGHRHRRNSLEHRANGGVEGAGHLRQRADVFAEVAA
ncbi:hypothetical protein D3C87_1858510 [compost metagenome]